MFDYTICAVADEKLFYEQCRAFERTIPFLNKQTLLEDVDGSLIQEYEHPDGRIVVRNDVQVDALYVTSDFDLLPFLRDGHP